MKVLEYSDLLSATMVAAGIRMDETRSGGFIIVVRYFQSRLAETLTHY